MKSLFSVKSFIILAIVFFTIILPNHVLLKKLKNPLTTTELTTSDLKVSEDLEVPLTIVVGFLLLLPFVYRPQILMVQAQKEVKGRKNSSLNVLYLAHSPPTLFRY